MGRQLLVEEPKLGGHGTGERGFAKVELGLPFMRGAGIPVPPPLRLSSLVVDNGGIEAQGAVLLQPIDYADLASALSDLQESARATPQAVSADPDVVDARGTEQGYEGYGLMAP